MYIEERVTRVTESESVKLINLRPLSHLLLHKTSTQMLFNIVLRTVVSVSFSHCAWLLACDQLLSVSPSQLSHPSVLASLFKLQLL